MAKNSDTIKLLNTNRHVSVTVRSFDGEEVTLPANQKEAVAVHKKFAWMLPAGVRNMTDRSSRKDQDLTADPDAKTADNKEPDNTQNTDTTQNTDATNTKVSATSTQNSTAPTPATDKPPGSGQSGTADSTRSSSATSGNVS